MKWRQAIYQICSQKSNKDVQGTKNYNIMKMDIETLKKNQSQVNNTISDIKDILEGTNNGIEDTEY